MRFYTTQHPLYCGIDLHARAMYVCILNQSGDIVLHRHMKTTPETFLPAIAPYREGRVVAVACLCTWYGLADLCTDAGRPCVLGHALSMKASQGGKAKNDQIDAHTIAVVLRGGMLPPAEVSPAQMRATRDLLRRRRPLAHQRAELLAPGHHTTSPYTLPAMGKKLAYTANRDGVAERCADPAVQQRIAVALALITSDEELRRDVERTIVTTARHHDANTLSLLHTVPGMGTMLRLVRLDAIQDITRFPRVQDVVSSGRLVTWARESAGKRSGTSGTKMGHAHLQWAFSEAAVWFLRAHPPAQQDLARVEKNSDQGNALTVLAPKVARAVYSMLTRHVAFEREQCFPREGRGAGEPGASLDKHGRTRQDARAPAFGTASLNAQARLGRETLRPALCLDNRSRSCFLRR